MTTHLRTGPCDYPHPPIQAGRHPAWQLPTQHPISPLGQMVGFRVCWTRLSPAHACAYVDGVAVNSYNGSLVVVVCVVVVYTNFLIFSIFSIYLDLIEFLTTSKTRWTRFSETAVSAIRGQLPPVYSVRTSLILS